MVAVAKHELDRVHDRFSESPKQVQVEQSPQKHQGRVPWRLFKSATLLLIVLWACTPAQMLPARYFVISPCENSALFGGI
eukprot:77581-Amphidinium_carterae.1